MATNFVDDYFALFGDEMIFDSRIGQCPEHVRLLPARLRGQGSEERDQ